MAIDTANKRGSVLGMLPLPDGTVGELDRPQILQLYSGIYTFVNKLLFLGRLTRGVMIGVGR